MNKGPGIWSNSRSGNLRYSVNRENQSGIFLGPTRGLSSPKNSRRACLCVNTNTYSVSCCKGALMSQGIGQVESTAPVQGGFGPGFDNGFD